MNNRYDNSRIFRDDNGRRYLSRIEYPPIPLRDSDILISFMNLANQYYENKNLWWIIARANQQTESVYMVPGKEYRIPQEIKLILQEYEELNR